MNTIKRTLFSKIKSIFYILLVFLFCTSFDLFDVQYAGRYVDLNNVKFYDADFYVTMNLHANLVTQMSPMWYSSPSGTEGNPSNVITTAANQWNNISGSFFNFTIDVSTLPTGFPILFDESGANPSNPEFNVIGVDNGTFFPEFDATNTQKNKLAVTHRYFSETGLDCSNWFAPRIRGADIVINRYALWMLCGDSDCGTYGPSSYDFRSAILHELGHVAGIKHHPPGVESDVMDGIVLKLGTCDRTLSGLDVFAMTRLYGGQDVGQTSSIDCFMFVTSHDEGLKGGIYTPPPSEDCTCTCDGNCCNSRIASDATSISQDAMKNISLFASNKVHFNINILRNLFIENQNELITMATSPLPKYKQLQKALNNFKTINAPLVDAAFRCESNNSLKGLLIGKENINSFTELVTQVITKTKSTALKQELIKLKRNIPAMEGKTIQQAAVMYDRDGF
ncbi:MAG: hypothetical protein HY841_00220 [Bacteroidetes bacterium]|nr:hypothetical protein [Bacteroidota bacterium]